MAHHFVSHVAVLALHTFRRRSHNRQERPVPYLCEFQLDFTFPYRGQ